MCLDEYKIVKKVRMSELLPGDVFVNKDNELHVFVGHYLEYACTVRLGEQGYPFYLISHLGTHVDLTNLKMKLVEE